MEDKRTAFAILLCTVIVVVYTQVFLAPYQQQALQAPATQQVGQQGDTQQQAAIQTGATPQVDMQAAQAPGSAASPMGSFGALPVASAPTTEMISSAGVVSINTGRAELQLALLGGRILNLRLNGYRRELKEADSYSLVSAASGAKLPLGLWIGNVDDSQVRYNLKSVSGLEQISDQAYRAQPNQEAVIELQSDTGVIKRLRFPPNSYTWHVDVAGVASGTPVSLEWAHVLSQEALQERLDPIRLTMLSAEGDIKHISSADMSKSELQAAGKTRWSALGDKYFMSAIMPTDSSATASYGHVQDDYFIRATQQGASTFKVYTGPKDIDELGVVGDDLYRAIDLGFFAFLAQPLLIFLKFFYNLLGNWGLAVIGLTLALKLLFYPLNKASFVSMKAMQALQPEIKALRERVKDATQLNQEMMALYKRRGVNPLGGCFPILIQIPVFFGLYNALLNSIDLRHANFALWINDLSSPEKLHIWGVGVPLMILLMGASMFFQQKLQPSAMDPQQQKIMNMMPIIFTGMFIVYPMPSGLVLYWLVNNVMSITQQVSLRSEKGINPLTATIVAAVAMFGFGFALTII